jgi:hypothetical protein
MREEDGEEIVPGKVAAEDYRRQRQTAAHGRDGFAAEVRARFEDHMANGRDQILAIARSYGFDNDQASRLVDLHVAEVTTDGISTIDVPYGHRIIRGIVDEVTAICSSGGVPLREGVVVGVSPTDGLHALQSEVPLTGASIIDFAMPFTTFCNQFAILLTRTLDHNSVSGGAAVICDPAKVADNLRKNRALLLGWSLLLARYAIEGWPMKLPRSDEDAARLSTRLHILHAMELFAVAHEYGHHVLRHAPSDSSNQTGNETKMEHDADGFARMVSMAIGTNTEPPNFFEVTGAGGALMLGALELVQRTAHVLTEGNTDFPPGEVHPPFKDRIQHLASFDRFVPEDLREQCEVMRNDFVGIIDQIWAAVEGMFLGMFRDAGVRLRPEDRHDMGWNALI